MNRHGSRHVHSYLQISLHVWVRHVPHVNESTYERVMSHTWTTRLMPRSMRVDTLLQINIVPRCLYTCERVMSHVWMSHFSRMSESCLTYERVIYHVAHLIYIVCRRSNLHWGLFDVTQHTWVSHVAHVQAHNRMHTAHTLVLCVFPNSSSSPVYHPKRPFGASLLPHTPVRLLVNAAFGSFEQI